MKQNLITRVTIDKLSLVTEIITNKFFCKYRRKKLENQSFSIIFNNCWGAHIYQRYGLQYNTPTVGCYFFSSDYIEFLSDIEGYLNSELVFIMPEQSKYYDILKRKKQLNTPVGVLNNKVEVIFLHYANETEALEKWNRRKKRVNLDNLLVKFAQMNLCEKKHIKQYEQLDFKNKILFLSKDKKIVSNNAIYISRYYDDNCITNDTLDYKHGLNITKLLNGMERGDNCD